MEQQPAVFAGTYRDNLLIGAENLPFDDEEKMQQELQTACVKAATYAHANRLQPRAIYIYIALLPLPLSVL